MTSPSKKIVYFTEQQLIKIYEATWRSTDINVIMAKATELYPDIVDERGVPIWKLPSQGRSFDISGGTCERPAFVLVSKKCNSIGVMRDGTPHPF